MTRETKFRGRSINGVWVYGQFTRIKVDTENFKSGSYISDFIGKAIPVRLDTVSQYTHINDEDSREIYEGDIVKFQTEINERVKTGYIVYQNGGYYIAVKDHSKEDKARFHFLGAVKNSLKVAGNIYENLEKLK